MPEIIKKEDGTEFEAFTEEEVNARIDDATQKAKTELETEYQGKIQEQTTAMEDLKKEREELEEKMNQGSDDKDKNFKVLKDALNKKDDEIKNLTQKIDETGSARINDLRERLIEKYAGSDEELKKKIVHNFDNTLAGVDAKSEKEIENKIKNAVKLSVDFGGPNPLDNAMSGGEPGGVGRKNAGGVSAKITPEVKDLGGKLGITDEDYQKYGSK